MSRQYEAVYIFDSTLEDAAIQEKIARHHALLHTTEEIKVEHWGRRLLAYKIGRRETGYYVVARFSCEAEWLPEFERALKLDDGVVRYLIHPLRARTRRNAADRGRARAGASSRGRRRGRGISSRCSRTICRWRSISWPISCCARSTIRPSCSASAR